MSTRDTAGRFRRYAEQIARDGDLDSLIPEQSPFEKFESAQIGAAARALEKLRRDEEPSLGEASAFEALIRPRTRPIVDVIAGSYEEPPAPWAHYDSPTIRAKFHVAIPAVGRIDVPPTLGLPFAGTGFVVGVNLLMTNRHVAKHFTSGLGRRNLRFTHEASVNFLRERDNPGSVVFELVEVLMIHPWWDMALFRVAGLSDVAPLRLSHRAPEDLTGQDIAVIGYPALDPRNDVATQAQILRGIYDIKRLQPGKLWERRTISSFRNMVSAVTHDCSTLGGNSGSAVVLAASGDIAALHFAGRFRDANFAVPTYELARDARLVDAGLNFTGSVPATDEWDNAWRDTEASRKPAVFRAADLPSAPDEGDPAAEPAASRIGTRTDGRHLTLTIPLSAETVHITISVGGETTTMSQPGVSLDADVEAARAIAPDPDFAARPGYKSDFLGPDHPVPVPFLSEGLYAEVALCEAVDEPHLLKYHHFSICQSKSRRLPFFSAVNIDGTREVSIPRAVDRWYLDPRISRDYQLTSGAYAGTPLDRGHLVRRIDPVWGTNNKEARLAHDDTFHWTNSTPQHAKFNRNKKTWALVENHILKHTNKDNRRASVFTGPIFAPEDPIVITPAGVEVQLPLAFWKVVACVNDKGALAASGFLISQEDVINAWLEELEFPVTDDVKPFQVSIAEIEQLTDLSFGDLTQQDTLGTDTESTASRHRIETLDDIVC